MQNNEFRCGFVALIGRTNAGKSTLVNALTGEKVSITSPKSQTTRNKIRAIVNVDERGQIIFVDTPGIHDWLKRALNRAMVETALSALGDADLAVMLIDAQNALEGEQIAAMEASIIEELKKVNTPSILAINKVDTLKDPALVLPIIDAYQKAHNFAHIVPISALKRRELAAFNNAVLEFLPINPKLYPDDVYTDQAERFLAAELIRECIVRQTQKELPYSVMVEIDDYKENAHKGLIKITASIFVERESQKTILVGKRGERIKSIGTEARLNLERVLGTRVFLNTMVRVKENWPEKINDLKRFGYIESKKKS
ncbi:MAG: GTPase Era [Bradymonadales bacterium]